MIHTFHLFSYLLTSKTHTFSPCLYCTSRVKLAKRMFQFSSAVFLKSFYLLQISGFSVHYAGMQETPN